MYHSLHYPLTLYRLTGSLHTPIVITLPDYTSLFWTFETLQNPILGISTITLWHYTTLFGGWKSSHFPFWDFWGTPDPMNHEKILKGWLPETPLRSWYNCCTKHFRLTDFCQAEMKTPTRLSNKTSTAWSYAEATDQIVENKISETGS